MHQNRAHFLEGLNLIFGKWPILKTAVEEEWGGHQSAEKADWLVNSLLEHFDERGRKIDLEELEDILLDVLAREFNVILEDSSERIISSKVLVLFQQCVKGDATLLNQLRTESSLMSATSMDHSIIDDSSDGEEVE